VLWPLKSFYCPLISVLTLPASLNSVLAQSTELIVSVSTPNSVQIALKTATNTLKNIAFFELCLRGNLKKKEKGEKKLGLKQANTSLSHWLCFWTIKHERNKRGNIRNRSANSYCPIFGPCPTSETFASGIFNFFMIGLLFTYTRMAKNNNKKRYCIQSTSHFRTSVPFGNTKKFYNAKFFTYTNREKCF